MFARVNVALGEQTMMIFVIYVSVLECSWGASQKYPPITGLSPIRQNLSGYLLTSIVTRLKLVFDILMVDF